MYAIHEKHLYHFNDSQWKCFCQLRLKTTNATPEHVHAQHICPLPNAGDNHRNRYAIPVLDKWTDTDFHIEIANSPC